VSLFYHLTSELKNNDGKVFFVERSGSSSTAEIKERGTLIIEGRTERQLISTAALLRGDLLHQFEAATLPEVLLLCPNPDQLPEVLHTFVQLIERLHAADGKINTADLPIIVLASNGIYYQRLRQQFIEQLEEATLLGRLPDLWPDIMPRIVGHLLRGVTIQTGLRDGAGADAVYHPGPPGITRLAGGDVQMRVRACTLLQGRGGWFELSDQSSATRLEFDKAIVNLSANLLGQFYAIDPSGNFTPLRVREIATSEHADEIRELAEHVFAIGRAVNVYRAGEDFEKLFAALMETTHQHDEHIPSSLQWIGLRLRQGTLRPELTPTEEWLLNPLIRYAHAAGQHDAGHYFENLRKRAVENLARAAERRGCK
jgi:hypothetical protein